MSDKVFTNREWKLRERPNPDTDDTALRIEVCVEDTPKDDEGEHLKPYVTWWDEGPPPEGGGFYTFSAKRCREIAAALLQAAVFVERATEEGERRGWRWYS